MFITPVDELTLEIAMNEVQNTIYKVASDYFEALEHQDLITGSGHHLAQRLALDAKMKVRARWNYTDDNKEEASAQ